MDFPTNWGDFMYYSVVRTQRGAYEKTVLAIYDTRIICDGNYYGYSLEKHTYLRVFRKRVS